MAITPWLHYADPTLAPLCRSPPGSNVPISDSDQYRRWLATQDLVLRQEHAPGDKLFVDYAGDETVRDLLEILDDRYDRRSTMITSQIPIEQWHAYLGDRTVADAILDRLVHNSYRLILKGDSMRRHKTTNPKSSVPSKAKSS